MSPVRERLINLFGEKQNIDQLRILQKNDNGYTSIVYLISIDKTEYAVKMFHPRFNGSEICLKERNQLIRAKKIIPEAVPKVFFISKNTQNEFNREILVMERIKGSWLDEDGFSSEVFNNLIGILKKLHIKRKKVEQHRNEIDRLDQYENIITTFQKRNPLISQKRILKHLMALKNYYLNNKEVFNVPFSLTHGDLWLDNILVDKKRSNIIDWLESKEQDYCLDIAQFRIGVLDELFDKRASGKLFLKVIETYSDAFEDKTLPRRIQFHLPMMYLEEAFYLPYEHFDWKIKSEEDLEKFRKRVIDYFEKSEISLMDGELCAWK